MNSFVYQGRCTRKQKASLLVPRRCTFLLLVGKAIHHHVSQWCLIKTKGIVMKNIFIIFTVFCIHFIFAQQLAVESLSHVSKSTDIKIKIKESSEIISGTIYRYDSSKLILNTSRLQKRDFITIGVTSGIFTGVGYLIALGSKPLTERYKVLSEISVNEIQQIQVKKTNNRNASIASGLLAVGFLSQANKPEMEGSALAFVWLPISLTPFLLKSYFSFSWETVFIANN